MVDNLSVSNSRLTERRISRVAEGWLRPVGDAGGAPLRDTHIRPRPEEGLSEVRAHLTCPEHDVDAFDLYLTLRLPGFLTLL